MSNKPKEYLLAWLGVNGPDEWHRVACSWNWDAGHDVLRWIIDQDGCDRATALVVFWRGAPDSYLQFRDRAAAIADKPYYAEPFDLLTAIVSNWRAGRYVTSNFSTDGEVESIAFGYTHLEREIGLENVPFSVPDEMRRDIGGKQLNVSNYAEGYPLHLVEFFREENIPF